MKKMKTSVLLIAQICSLSAEARLWKKTRDLQDGAASTRIIGGGEAKEDRFSYAVSLHTEGNIFQPGSHFCGASLIARDMVISAAHCAGGSYDAIIGRHDHGDRDGETVDVVAEYTHPSYSKNTNNYDVMVLKLARPTEAVVTPVKINSSGSTPSTNAAVTVVGWGVTEWGSTSDELKEVEVTVVSEQSCRSSYYKSYGYNAITDAMLCAADPGEDSCQGDSGGPLVVKGTNAEEDLLVGVVSWGQGCAEDNFPGVYTRVSSAYDWIRDTVCENSQDEDARSRFQCPNSTPTAPVVAETQADSGGATESTVSMSEEENDNSFDYYYYDEDDDNEDSWLSSWSETVESWWNSWWG